MVLNVSDQSSYLFIIKQIMLRSFYQTYLEAENTKQLGAAANELQDQSPLPMNSMLQKEDRQVAVERRQARQKMAVVHVPPTTSCKVYAKVMYQ